MLIVCCGKNGEIDPLDAPIRAQYIQVTPNFFLYEMLFRVVISTLFCLIDDHYKTMQQDYRYDCLANTEKEELTELAMRMLHRLVPEPVVREIFHFQEQEKASDERQQEAYFDATLRLHAVALGEIPALFAESQSAEQNIDRMTRLILWHFYAIGFQLEPSINLQTHCAEVEARISPRPKDTLAWSNTLTELLYRYAALSQDAQK